jgi:hypothetical protein
VWIASVSAVLELARVLVRFNHVARFMAKTNHGIV